MKHLLMAAMVAASTLALTNIAMASDNGGTECLDERRATQTRWTGPSDGSFIRHLSVQRRPIAVRD